MLYTDIRSENEESTTQKDAIGISKDVQKSLKNSNIWKLSDSQSSDSKSQRKHFGL